MKGDLTQGSPLKKILLFSLPFLVGNLFQQLYNVVDMVVVGQFAGHDAYAAVGATGSIVWLATGAIQQLSVGFSTVTAASFGAKDTEGIKRSFARGIILSSVISLILTLICVIISRDLLTLMRTPEDIIDRANDYIICIYLGLFATAIFNLLSNTIRALGDSKTPLYFLIIACVINIILDIVFVGAFRLGTLGVGIATVMAQVIASVFCVIYIVKKQPLLHIGKKHFARDSSIDKRLLSIGLPMAFLNMVLAIGSITVQFATNGFGTSYVSAQATGAKIETFVTMPLLSLGSALAVYVAQNNGANKQKRILTGINSTLVLGLCWWILSSALLLPFGSYIVRLFAGADMPAEAVSNAHYYIIINCSLSFVVSTLIITKSALQALGRGISPMISGFFEILGRAGVAFLVVYLVTAAAIDSQRGFEIMCFANPAAWILAFIPVGPDYIYTVLKIRKKAKLQSLSKDGELTEDSMGNHTSSN